MNPRKRSRQSLRLLLAAAHRQQGDGLPGPGPAWRRQVMAGISRLRHPVFAVDPWAFFDRLVWRFVPAAGAVALLLAILVSRAGPDPAGELTRLLSADTAVSGLYTFYQGE